MSSKQFDKEWAELSQIQREAAEYSQGPVLVLAGPGSGKTRVLTCRIARILDTSQKEKFRVLGLTFTNKAADEMRTRVNNLVPGQEDRIFLGTFHSFCADILRQHGIHLGIKPNFKIYSQDGDLQAVLNDAVEKGKEVSELVTDLDKKTLPVIKRLKSRLIPPDKAKSEFRDEEFGERIEIVYGIYEEQLIGRNTLDFNSLIFRVNELLSKFPAIAKRYRTVYPHVCIDEFQDTNHAQYNLIRSLCGLEFKNVFIVADDDQIIYQWNGASYKRIEEFNKDYRAEIIQLPVNYRCPSEIIDLANNLIRFNSQRTGGKKPLESFKPSGGEDTIRLLDPFPDFDLECAGIAIDIKERHSAALSSVAVLGRNRRLLEGLREALTEEGLAAIILRRKDEFESTPFVWLQSILRLANDKTDLRNLEFFCGSFNRLSGIWIDPITVISESQPTNLSYLQTWVNLVRQLNPSESIKTVVDNVFESLVLVTDFRTFCNKALAWFAEINQAHPNGGDPAKEIFARYKEELRVWGDITTDITGALGAAVTLEAFLQELDMHSKEPPVGPDTVVLTTIHGAKGKEFEHVYLIGLVDDELPSFQSKEKGDDSPEMEEERRNCFVAVTRTLNSLTMSYSRSYRGWPKEPSRFLSEMGLLTYPHS